LRGATPSQTATFVFSLKAPLLSTPVVSLWQGVLAVPLIGTLDSHRTQVVMENLLQTIVTTGAQIAIIDITGVPTVDTLVGRGRASHRRRLHHQRHPARRSFISGSISMSCRKPAWLTRRLPSVSPSRNICVCRKLGVYYPARKSSSVLQF
jgi:hypothetical protein